MLVCPECQQINNLTSVFCMKCGYSLGDITLRQSTNSVTLSLHRGVVQTSILKTELGVFQSKLLSLSFDGISYHKDVYLQPGQSIILGRGIDPRDITPSFIDLTPYHAYGKGVSRRHAMLRRTNNTLEVIDLGSSNGTFINEMRLLPHQPFLFTPDHLLSLAKLKIQINFKTPSPQIDAE